MILHLNNEVLSNKTQRKEKIEVLRSVANLTSNMNPNGVL